MHDVHSWTANAVERHPCANEGEGIQVVQMKAKEPLRTLPEYDAMVVKEMNPASANARPMSSVIRTVQ
jgi:hypothetical protein